MTRPRRSTRSTPTSLRLSSPLSTDQLLDCNIGVTQLIMLSTGSFVARRSIRSLLCSSRLICVPIFLCLVPSVYVDQQYPFFFLARLLHLARNRIAQGRADEMHACATWPRCGSGHTSGGLKRNSHKRAVADQAGHTKHDGRATAAVMLSPAEGERRCEGEGGRCAVEQLTCERRLQSAGVGGRKGQPGSPFLVRVRPASGPRPAQTTRRSLDPFPP